MDGFEKLIRELDYRINIIESKVTSILNHCGKSNAMIQRHEWELKNLANNKDKPEERKKI